MRSCLLVALASPVIAVADGPRMEVPDVIELGEVMPRSTVDGIIEVRNSGTQELMVPVLERSCYCTFAGEEKFSLRPGGSKKVPFRVHVPNAIGPVESWLKFHTNELAGERTVLVRFDMQQVVRLERERLILWDLPKASLPWSREVRLRCAKEGWAFKHIQIKSQVEWVDCTIKQMAEEGGECLIEVRVEPSAPAGMWEIPVDITCTVEGAPRNYVANLVVAGSLVGKIHAEPEAIFIGSGDARSALLKVKGERIAEPSYEIVGLKPDDLELQRVGEGEWRIRNLSAKKTAQGLIVFLDEATGARVLAVPVYISP